MSAAENLDQLDDLVTLEVFCNLTGITKRAIYCKISERKLTLGKEFIRDPDRKIWIIRSGYYAWVRSGCPAPEKQQTQPKPAKPKTKKPSLRAVMAPASNSVRQLQ